MGSGAKVRIDWIGSSSCSVGLSGGLLRYWGQWIRSIIENVSMFSILLKTLKHFQFWHASQPYFISIENVYNLLYVALAHLVWYEGEDTFCDWGVRGGHALAAVVAASSPTYKPFHHLDSVQRISMRNYEYTVYKLEVLMIRMRLFMRSWWSWWDHAPKPHSRSCSLIRSRLGGWGWPEKLEKYGFE